MKASLKSICCRDSQAVDLAHWRPASAEFGLRIVLLVGAEGCPTSDAFDAYVATPGFFAARMAADPMIKIRHIFFMKTFDYQRLRACVEDYLGHCEAAAWPELARQIAQIAAPQPPAPGSQPASPAQP